MDAEIIGHDCRLTLSRKELVLLVGVMSAASMTVNSDSYFEELVGGTREEVDVIVDRLADLARAIPFEG